LILFAIRRPKPSSAVPFMFTDCTNDTVVQSAFLKERVSECGLS
jgi:hypothetical protein